MSKRIWLTWETQRRNRTLSRALDARLVELDYRLPRWRRYPRAIATTLKVLLKAKPELIFAQNPSLTLALLSVWYGRVTATPVVIDAHNAGVIPLEGRRHWINGLARHVMRMARTTIVTNRALADYVDSVGGRSFVLPDPLPQFEHTSQRGSGPEPTVLFICTWAADEPYLEVIKAAARIDPGIRVLITGNSKGREHALGQALPDNVILTGFVPEQGFLDLLHSADVVMDLTNRENCLVCGAYEAVAAGKPMVLSDTQALREYFNKGAVYTGNDAKSIAAAIERAIAEPTRLAAEVRQLEAELLSSWTQRRDELEAVLRQTPRSAAATTGV